ncbi:MAG: hypothetical protein ABH851_09530 [Methanobacteriota archaeon]
MEKRFGFHSQKPTLDEEIDAASRVISEEFRVFQDSELTIHEIRLKSREISLNHLDCPADRLSAGRPFVMSEMKLYGVERKFNSGEEFTPQDFEVVREAQSLVRGKITFDAKDKTKTEGGEKVVVEKRFQSKVGKILAKEFKYYDDFDLDDFKFLRHCLSSVKISRLGVGNNNKMAALEESTYERLHEKVEPVIADIMQFKDN